MGTRSRKKRRQELRVTAILGLCRFCCCAYYLTALPFRFCFTHAFTFSWAFAPVLVFDYIADLYLWVDVYLLYRQFLNISPALTDIVQASDRVKRVRFFGRSHNFLCSHTFAFHVLALCPFEVFGHLAGLPFALFLRANRLLFLFSLPTVVADLFRILEQKNLLTNIGLQRMGGLFFMMALAGHIVGCVFWLIAFDQAENGEESWPVADGLIRVAPDGHIDYLQPKTVCYLRAVYWAFVTMITTGFGDIVPLTIPETCWTILAMYLGGSISTCAIANLTLVVTNMDSARTAHQLRMEALKKYIKYRRLPAALALRISSYYEYQYHLLHGIDEAHFLKELPKTLAQQVTNVITRDLLKGLQALRHANPSLINALASRLESFIYSPNDEILRPGEKATGALLVSRGEIEVLSIDPVTGIEKVESILARGDGFAGESLFFPLTCEFLVRARTYCEVFHLSTVAFVRIAQQQCHPTELETMRNIAERTARTSSKLMRLLEGRGDAAVAQLTGFMRHCLPGSKFRRVWDMVIFLGLLYYTLSTPLLLSACARDDVFTTRMALFVTSYVMDAVFLVDLVFRIRFFMFTKEGLTVVDPVKICEQFRAQNTLWAEIVAAIPVDFVALALPQSYAALFRLTKMVRLPKLLQYSDRVENHLLDVTKHVSFAARRVIKLNCVLYIGCHWIGCLWLLVADASTRRLGMNTSWVEKDEGNPSLSIDHDRPWSSAGYLRGVYWAIVSMSTEGYGDIVPTNNAETTLALFVILFGGLMLPAIVGGLASLIGNLNASIKEFQAKMARLRSVMKNRKLPLKLQDRIIRYYDYLWSRQGGVRELQILTELPGPLRQRVALYISGPALASIPFFDHLSEGLQQYLVSVLRPRVFLPDDVIMHAGEVGSEMYIIERGIVYITSQDGRYTYALLCDGDYFGESCLLGASTRSATALAHGYVDSFVLTRESFNEVMILYPEQKSQVLDRITEVLANKLKSNRRVVSNMQSHAKIARAYGHGTSGTGTSLRLAVLHTHRLSSSAAANASETPGSNTRQARRGEMSKWKTFTATARVASNRWMHPESLFRHVWDVAVFFIIVYNAFAVPLRIAFQPRPITFVADYVLDVAFWVDMAFNATVFSFFADGHLVRDADRIRRHYVETRLAWDMVAAMPYDLLALAFLSRPSLIPFVMAVLRLPKLIRLRLARKYAASIERVLEEFTVSAGPLRLAQLLIVVVMIGHLAACCWFMFARFAHASENCDNEARRADIGSDDLDEHGMSPFGRCMFRDTWIQSQIESNKVDADGGSSVSQYIRALNWALPTLVVVVIGDVIPITPVETFYVFLWILLGVTINATIIGNIASLVANLQSESAEFVRRADGLKTYMHHNRVNKAVQQRVNSFMTYLWTSHNGVSNTDTLFNEQPFTLRVAVSSHLKVRYIKKCPFFDFCSEEIVRGLALRLQPQVYSIGDVIVQHGEMGQEMFFLEKGSVEVVSADGSTVYATLMSGAFFGETALFFEQKRSATVRSTGYSEVLLLTKRDLNAELKQREFDLSRMLEVFTDLQESNRRRNAAISRNLKLSEDPSTKLHKLVDPNSVDSTQRPHLLIRTFMPNSRVRAYWEIASLVLLIYLGLSVPYRVAFIFGEAAVARTLPWLTIDFAVDSFFVADAILRATSFAYMDNGAEITDVELIWERYCKSSLFLDVVSSLPLELVAMFTGSQSVFAWRLVHVLRLVRMGEYFRHFDHHLYAWGYRVRAATMLLLRMFVYYILVNHWYGCIWFMIHRFAERHVEITWATADGLAQYDEETGEHNICSVRVSDCYVRAFYFVITTISSVGYGDIAPQTDIETVWEIIVVLTGACLFAAVIGAFGAYLEDVDTTGETAFKQKMQVLKKYMRFRRLPERLRNAIELHHHYLWNKSQVLDVQDVMSDLAIPLRMDLAMAVNHSLIENVPIFMELPQMMKKRVAMALRTQYAVANTVIYDAGDIGWDIYFIMTGQVRITMPDDPSVLDAAGRAAISLIERRQLALGSILRTGSHFGESCLASLSGVRQENSTTHSVCELYLLSKQSLDEILHYTSTEQRHQLILNLMTRNGNVRHTLGEFTTADDENNVKRAKQKPMSDAVPDTPSAVAAATTAAAAAHSTLDATQSKFSSFLRSPDDGRNRSDDSPTAAATAAASAIGKSAVTTTTGSGSSTRPHSSSSGSSSYSSDGDHHDTKAGGKGDPNGETKSKQDEPDPDVALLVQIPHPDRSTDTAESMAAAAAAAVEAHANTQASVSLAAGDEQGLMPPDWNLVTPCRLTIRRKAVSGTESREFIKLRSFTSAVAEEMMGPRKRGVTGGPAARTAGRDANGAHPHSGGVGGGGGGGGGDGVVNTAGGASSASGASFVQGSGHSTRVLASLMKGGDDEDDEDDEQGRKPGMNNGGRKFIELGGRMVEVKADPRPTESSGEELEQKIAEADPSANSRLMDDHMSFADRKQTKLKLGTPGRRPRGAWGKSPSRQRTVAPMHEQPPSPQRGGHNDGNDDSYRGSSPNAELNHESNNNHHHHHHSHHRHGHRHRHRHHRAREDELPGVSYRPKSLPPIMQKGGGGPMLDVGDSPSPATELGEGASFADEQQANASAAAARRRKRHYHRGKVARRVHPASDAQSSPSSTASPEQRGSPARTRAGAPVQPIADVELTPIESDSTPEVAAAEPQNEDESAEQQSSTGQQQQQQQESSAGRYQFVDN